MSNRPGCFIAPRTYTNLNSMTALSLFKSAGDFIEIIVYVSHFGALQDVIQFIKFNHLNMFEAGPSPYALVEVDDVSKKKIIVYIYLEGCTEMIML